MKKSFLIMVLAAMLSFQSHATTCGALVMQPNAEVGLKMLDAAIAKAKKGGGVSEHWAATVKASRDEMDMAGTTYGYDAMVRAISNMCQATDTPLHKVFSY